MKNLMLSLSLLLLVPLSAVAEDAPKSYVEGKNYDVISPAIRTADPDKIEVVEFFWYGCHHCYNFEPLIEAWEKTLPDNVDFQRSPAVWNDAMQLHARAFYTAQVLGVERKMTPIIFQAMNVDGERLASEEEIRDLFVANGVKAEDFTKAFESFGVNSQVNQAVARARAAKLNGTPAMMVDGKYFISTGKAGGQPGMLKVADFLIEKERTAKSGG